jgi:RHS repeat-associated protein
MKRWVLLLLVFAATTVQAIGINQVGQPPQRSNSPGPSQPRGPYPAPPGMQPTVPRPQVPAGLQNYRDPTEVAEALAAQQKAAAQTATDALGAVFTYDGVGNRKTATYGNGVLTTYTYDRRDRLTDLHTTYNGATLHRFQYTLDPSGLRTQVVATEADGTVRTTTYTYDAVKRLTGESQQVANTMVFQGTYTYDRVGNRLSATVNGTTTTYVYDANDRLERETTVGGAASGTITYLYDLAGNRTEKSGPMGTVTYLYDDAGRMSEVRSAGEVVEYRYSHEGLLLEKTLTPLSGTPTTWRYLWDVGRGTPQTIEEYSRQGSGPEHLDATYLFGDDLIAQTRGGLTHYVLADGLGDTRALVDTAGAVSDTFAYDAWGNVLARTGGTTVDHLHHGERFDPNAGFYYLRARWMDPGVGRFTQMDAFEGFGMDPPSLHKYTYAHANPMAYSDPSGHFSLTNLTTVINIIGAGSTAIHAGFRIAEGDYRGAAYEVARDAAFWGLGAGVGKIIAPLSKSALSLFSRTFMVPLENGLARSGAVLTRNMEAVMRKAGMVKPAGWQAHHIVGEAYPEGKAAMEILRRYKIDVNSPLNGVFLPGCGSTGTGGIAGLAVHCGKHVQAYEAYVLEQLSVLGRHADESSVVNVLSRIRQELMTGELALNRRGNL